MFKKSLPAGHWCLIPIILATQEAEIRLLEANPRQIVLETLTHHKTGIDGVAQVVRAPV
jgi:hypothetical protein